jgi:hypothetical protein
MPTTTTPLPGETIGDIAARVLGDASLFREVAALNPGLNLFGAVAEGGGAMGEDGEVGGNEQAITQILVPLKSEIANRVSPALTSVRAGVESALRIADSAIAQVEKYAGIAESLGLAELSAEVNGVLGPVKNALAEGQAAVTEYGSEAGAVKLVDWLLG